MSMKYVVAYRTRRGSTKRYADWLAADLGVFTQDFRQVSDEQIAAADVVVLCSTNYYGLSLGAHRFKQLVRQYPEKHFVVVFVGSTPMPREYGGISGHRFMFHFNYPAEKFPHLAWCWCMGAYDPAQQHPWDRLVLYAYGDYLAARAKKEPVKPFKKMREDLRYGCDGCDQANLAPMVEYLKGLTASSPLPAEPLNLTLR